MSATGSTAERIVHARRAIETALENWNAADLSQLDICRALLEESVGGLEAVESSLRSENGESPAELRAAILELKKEIAKAVRLTDAGLAFYRGVALRMGSAATSYGPPGCVGECPPAIGLSGLEG